MNVNLSGKRHRSSWPKLGAAFSILALMQLLAFTAGLLSQARAEEALSNAASEKSSVASTRPTRAGIIAETNRERRNHAMLPLKESELLNRIAEERLSDMIQKQYFGHYSPSGQSVDSLAKRAGYRYRRLGENLEDISPIATSRQLVRNWMKSPEHRKNILNPDYREIGVAVKRGRLKETVSWIVVQVFGQKHQALGDGR